MSPRPSEPAIAAVLFDLDGVLADTARLHFQSWQVIAADLNIPFDQHANEALRGLGRMESLMTLLAERKDAFSPKQREEICARKNDVYLKLVHEMKPGDALPGAKELLSELGDRQVRLGLSSSSRNARVVLDRLLLTGYFKTIVDGNDVAESKPSPALFLEAARRLAVAPRRCVVVEDAASGIAAAKAAHMKVFGVGPVERVGAADRCAARLSDIAAADLLSMLDRLESEDREIRAPATSLGARDPR